MKGPSVLNAAAIAALFSGAVMLEAGEVEVPLGKKLPSVAGNSLAGGEVRFPEDLAGRPAVLLVAYRRGTQPDVDRWMAFVGKEAPGVALFEVPTIPNPVWRPVSGWIDSGMRGGVPRVKWGAVVTLYGDAPLLRDFLGDRGGYTTHVVLLDREGRVAWFDAGGFTEESARALAGAIRALGDAP